MTATAVIGLRSRRSRRAAAKLLADDGVGLVELLIALLVLNIGIFATLAAFTGGALALGRASHVSTASAIADNYMECFRDVSYADITWPLSSTVLPAGSVCATATNVVNGQSIATTTGPDGRQYDVVVTISAGDQTSGVTTTTPTYQGSSAVKVVTLTVSDVADGNKVLVKTSSTFSQCAQDMTTTACQS